MIKKPIKTYLTPKCKKELECIKDKTGLNYNQIIEYFILNKRLVKKLISEYN